MPPRPTPNPTPKTSSARAALSSFYCTLCQKGYSRSNEYEAHLSSYDHSHKQRLKDMRQLSRDPMAGEKARKAELKANESGGFISIKLGGGDEKEEGGKSEKAGATGGNFKKGGFKKAGFKSAFAPADEAGGVEEKRPTAVVPGARMEVVESDTEDEGYEVYDPRRPTD